ncbi:MAG: iron-sulfur cluster assembly accessory protein [Actinomycetota bacterium]
MPNDIADPIAVTESAARKARSLAEREGRPDAYLRVRVRAGGCSGYTYSLSFEDAPEERDVVVRSPDGFGVLIDPASLPIVTGSTLDFDGALMGGGLRMRNPQAKSECACGDSFTL